MKPKNNQTTAPADTWNFEEKIKEWEAKHTTRAVIDGCERYWYFAFQELWGIYAEFIRRLKDEYNYYLGDIVKSIIPIKDFLPNKMKEDLSIGALSLSDKFEEIIDKLAGKELSGEKE
jgi:hypothetical protein